jgi:hypothetical protein
MIVRLAPYLGALSAILGISFTFVRGLTWWIDRKTVKKWRSRGT